MDPNTTPPKNDDSTRDAAANVVRDQIDAIYSNDPRVVTPAPQQNPAQSQPQAATDADADQSAHWQQYHAQWQNYYQKYYERYYVGHLHQALKDQSNTGYVAEPQTSKDARNEQVLDLRQKIVSNAKDGAQKARKSRHFIPIISSFAVVLIVAFLQYNQIIFANVQAYVSPGAIDPNNIVVDPNTSVQVSADPKLIIPKINVDVPVQYGVGYDYNSQMAAMEKGVAQFAIPGADSKPGQVGNTVFAGHSSNDLFEPGDYKFIFAQLDKLNAGDTINVNYNSVRYTYTVTTKQVVKPTNVGVLYNHNDKPYLTLITCTPLGTSTNRLIVTAEQTSPDPAKATAPNTSTGSTNASIPGNAPSALEKLFGAKG